MQHLEKPYSREYKVMGDQSSTKQSQCVSTRTSFASKAGGQQQTRAVGSCVVTSSRFPLSATDKTFLSLFWPDMPQNSFSYKSSALN